MSERISSQVDTNATHAHPDSNNTHTDAPIESSERMETALTLDPDNLLCTRGGLERLGESRSSRWVSYCELLVICSDVRSHIVGIRRTEADDSIREFAMLETKMVHSPVRRSRKI